MNFIKKGASFWAAKASDENARIWKQMATSAFSLSLSPSYPLSASHHSHSPYAMMSSTPAGCRFRGLPSAMDEGKLVFSTIHRLPSSTYQGKPGSFHLRRGEPGRRRQSRRPTPSLLSGWDDAAQLSSSVPWIALGPHILVSITQASDLRIVFILTSWSDECWHTSVEQIPKFPHILAHPANLVFALPLIVDC
jgi:hypothetical protein